MHIEKKSLISKKAATATIIDIHSRRVDISKPAQSRLLTARLSLGAACSSGKHTKNVVITL